MAWDSELAKLFNERNNIKPHESQLGEVISIEPLKIALFDNKVILDEDHFYICSALEKEYVRKADMKIKAYSVECSAMDSGGDSTEAISIKEKSDYDVEIKFKDIFKKGDKLLCLPTNNGQKYFIIDKVVI